MIRSCHIAGLLALLALAGCSSVEQLHFVDPKLAPAPIEGVGLDLVHVSPNIKAIEGRELLVEIGKIEMTANAARSRLKRSRNLGPFRADFEKTLSDALWTTGVFKDVGLRGDDPPIAAPNLRLRLAVTEWHEGYSLLRATIGTWAGATRVQVEGVLDDPATGEVFAAFADARTHPGSRPYMPMTWRPQQLIAIDLANFVDDLRRAVYTITGREAPPGVGGVALPRPSRVPEPPPDPNEKILPEPKPTIIS